MKLLAKDLAELHLSLLPAYYDSVFAEASFIRKKRSTEAKRSSMQSEQSIFCDCRPTQSRSTVGMLGAALSISFPEIAVHLTDVLSHSKFRRASDLAHVGHYQLSVVMPKNAEIEWFPRDQTEFRASEKQIAYGIKEWLIPLANETMTMQGFVSLFEAGDPRICRAALDESVKVVAIYLALGEIAKAKALAHKVFDDRSDWAGAGVPGLNKIYDL
jgi:hypothetical protein